MDEVPTRRQSWWGFIKLAISPIPKIDDTIGAIITVIAVLGLPIVLPWEPTIAQRVILALALVGGLVARAGYRLHRQDDLEAAHSFDVIPAESGTRFQVRVTNHGPKAEFRAELTDTPFGPVNYHLPWEADAAPTREILRGLTGLLTVADLESHLGDDGQPRFSVYPIREGKAGGYHPPIPITHECVIQVTISNDIGKTRSCRYRLTWDGETLRGKDVT